MKEKYIIIYLEFTEDGPNLITTIRKSEKEIEKIIKINNLIKTDYIVIKGDNLKIKNF